MNSGSRGDSLRVTSIKKILIYGSILFILAIAQCSFFSSLTFLPATPNIVLGALAAIALFETRECVAVFSLCAGFMIDALGGSGITASAAIMLAFSVILCSVSAKILKGFFPWVLMLALASILSVCETYLRLILAGHADNTAFVFGGILLPELIYTFFISLPLYFIFKLAAKTCKSKGRFKM